MNLRRSVSRLVIPLAASLVVASSGLAQSAPTTPQDKMAGLHPPTLGGQTNAALLYFQAFERLSQDDAKLIVEKYTDRKAGRFPDEETAKVLLANQRYIEDLMFAANTSACDFGVRYDQGFEALLPHLGHMRRGVRVLLADAFRLVREGKSDGAAKRVSAAIRMAEHASRDRILISSLVGGAITSAGVNFCEELLAEGALTSEVARAASTALKEQREDDYMGFRAAVHGESTLAVDWARGRFKGATAGADFARVLTASTATSVQEMANPLTKMDETQLGVELDRLAAYYAEVQSVWDTPDAAKRLTELEEELQQGKWGAAAQVAGAAFGKSRVSSQRIRAERDLAIKRLDAFLRGEDPNVVAPLGGEAAKKGEAKK